ncbi:hypothetical protein [Arthrobacter alkaliphilus]|uniref:hypothetical protein n=1 Tax=Arthrobacter alkaliphilus TaxID=369936 RepID=UPI001F33D28A|nr:hypothetical protein [Arthrobacter alkaliphilus]
MPEEGHHGGVELSVGEELEARAVRALTDDPDELAHHRGRVFHEFGEPVPDLFLAGQGELGPDGLPDLVRHRSADDGLVHQ